MDLGGQRNKTGNKGMWVDKKQSKLIEKKERKKEMKTDERKTGILQNVAQFRQLCACYDEVCSSWRVAVCSPDIDPARRAEERHSCFLMSERISSPVPRMSFYPGAIGFEPRT